MLAVSDIKIVGVGGAGLAVLSDIFSKFPEANLVAIDTDISALEKCPVKNKICLIENGEGAGGDTDIAKKAAASRADELTALTLGTRMIVIISGLGGGTGSVVAPMLCKVASANAELKIFSYSTLPLAVEGAEKTELAKKAQSYLARRAKAAFALPNDIILARQNSPVAEAYACANSYLTNAIVAAVKSASNQGIVNIDFPAFVKIFSKTESDNEKSKPFAFAAFGRGYGENAVSDAVEDLLNSPLLPKNFKARSMLLSLRCSTSFPMNKMQMLLELVSNKFGRPAKFAFGAIADDSFDTNIEICAMGICLVEEEMEHVEQSHQNVPFSNSASPSAGAVNIPQTQEIPTEHKERVLPQAPEPVAIPQKIIQQQVTQIQRPKKSSKLKIKAIFDIVKRRSPAKKVETENDKQQTQFGFMDSEGRGYFKETAPNIRNDVDLDIPTYKRRGMKL